MSRHRATIWLGRCIICDVTNRIFILTPMPRTAPKALGDNVIWYLSQDVGGAFTDLVSIDSGTKYTVIDRIPSSRRGLATHISEGIRRITAKVRIESQDIHLFVHGFTIATNAF